MCATSRPRHRCAVLGWTDVVVVVDPSEEWLFLLNMTELGQQAIYTGTHYMYDGPDFTPMRECVDAGLSGDHVRAARLYCGMEPLREPHRENVGASRPQGALDPEHPSGAIRVAEPLEARAPAIARPRVAMATQTGLRIIALRSAPPARHRSESPPSSMMILPVT